MITRPIIVQELSSYNVVENFSKRRRENNFIRLKSPQRTFNRFKKKCTQLFDAYQMTDTELQRLDTVLKKANSIEKISPFSLIANESQITRFITNAFETSIVGGTKMVYYVPMLENTLKELNEKCCSIIFKARCNTKGHHIKFPITKKEEEDRLFCMSPGN
jgi:hypothetical protein